MFKVGDRVRCIETHPSYPQLIVGKEYTVKKLGLIGDKPTVFISKPKSQEDKGYFFSRFELVTSSPNEPFNVSTATDQELADEYRRLLDLRKPVYDALIQRGFTLTATVNGKKLITTASDAVNISKTEQITL